MKHESKSVFFFFCFISICFNSIIGSISPNCDAFLSIGTVNFTLLYRKTIAARHLLNKHWNSNFHMEKMDIFHIMCYLPYTRFDFSSIIEKQQIKRRKKKKKTNNLHSFPYLYRVSVTYKQTVSDIKNKRKKK